MGECQPSTHYNEDTTVHEKPQHRPPPPSIGEQLFAELDPKHLPLLTYMDLGILVPLKCSRTLRAGILAHGLSEANGHETRHFTHQTTILLKSDKTTLTVVSAVGGAGPLESNLD
ncbi:unnamed protein product [Caretta caretta]